MTRFCSPHHCCHTCSHCQCCSCTGHQYPANQGSSSVPTCVKCGQLLYSAPLSNQTISTVEHR